METTLLKDLGPGSYTSKVVMRLMSLWEFRDKRTGDLYELNFLVVDREGNTMEGSVPKERINQYKNILKEGAVYSVQYFGYYNAKKSYRAANHTHRMVLTYRTKIEQINPPTDFPLFGHDVVPYDELTKRVGDNSFLSDVVGKVTAMSDIVSSSGTNQTRRHIYITDGVQRAVVTLWNDQALAFDAAALHEMSKKGHVFALFVAMTVGEYLRLLAFKSTTATKWYINPDIPQVTAIKQNLGTSPTIIEWENTGRPHVEPSDSTIALISPQIPSELMAQRFKLKVLVTEIVDDEDWWYLACTNCYKKTEWIENDVYRCSRCDCTCGKPRYKLVVRGIDVDSTSDPDAPFAEFVFWGAIGDDIIGIKAPDLANRSSSNTRVVPAQIEALTHKKIMLTVDVSAASLDKEYYVFYVQSYEPLDVPPVPYQLPTESTEENVVQSSEQNALGVAAVQKVAQSEHHREQVVFTPPTNDVPFVDSPQESGARTEEKKRKSKTESATASKKSGAAGGKGRSSAARELVYSEK